jgi:dethiobiotin synthetase
MAPAMAAELLAQPIAWDAITARWNCLREEGMPVLVEAAGGLMVPLDPAEDELTTLSLVGAFKLPVVLVATANLGTLNHAMLSVMALRAVDVHVLGIVICHVDAVDAQWAAQQARWLERMTGLPILAELEHIANYNPVQSDPPHAHQAAMAAMVPMLIGAGQ